MTLIGAILEKVKSNVSLHINSVSPPPEMEKLTACKKNKRKSLEDKYTHVKATVDTSPPRLDDTRYTQQLTAWRARFLDIYMENMHLLRNIRRAQLARGKVDCRWKVYPKLPRIRYVQRVHLYRNIRMENQAIYKRILRTVPKMVSTAILRREWLENRSRIIHIARNAFVLFPPVPQQIVEDASFQPPPGVKRPRVYLTLRIRGGAQLGTFMVELFTDICPKTCKLFLDLSAGDNSGYGYVKTCFFRKVPGLYWRGGDVVYNNGFGCYAQHGRRSPIAPENYFFSHSMPGLLSMTVTKDDEVCGIFNITFKPLLQFDLKNIVFGRVIRPCKTFDAMLPLGSPLSSWPIVEVESSRRRCGARWVTGRPNTRLCGR
ncbi:hypothetical protein ACJJTC_002683 [Scirpophaga incertulas]